MLIKLKRQRKPSKEEISLKQSFYNLMFELELFNKFKKTYYLEIMERTNYGYYAKLYLVPGLSYDRLTEKRAVIEQSLQCMWIMKTQTFRSYAEVQIVLNPIDKDMEYTNPNIKPYEIYLGLSFSNDIQKTNANDNCMFLLAGATGSGKTRYIYQVLLSWILGCSANGLWIYLSDVAKNEYVQFKNVKHVKYYASEIIDFAGWSMAGISIIGIIKNAMGSIGTVSNVFVSTAEFIDKITFWN